VATVPAGDHCIEEPRDMRATNQKRRTKDDHRSSALNPE